MTVAIDTEQAQQTRWREWQEANARASRRSAAQAKTLAIVALSLVGAFLLMQLFALPRVV